MNFISKRSYGIKIILLIVIFCLSSILLYFGCSDHEKSDLFQLKWTKYQNNPIVEPGFYGWDNKQVYPGTILKIDDGYLMWYYGSDEDGPLKIGIKKSEDGIEWKKIQDAPVLTLGEKEDWDGFRVSKPCVIFENNQYIMWYLGEAKQDNKVVPKIGYATSDDGILWTKNQQNPVFDLDQYNLPWASFLRFFWIIKEKDQYKMWFSAVSENVESIGYASSPNGFEWQIHPKPVLERDSSSVWEDFYVSNPYVFKTDSIYYMFYGGLGRYGYLFKEAIGLAKSYDGIHWQKYYDNPILIFTEESTAWDREFITNPRVLKIDKNSYYLWYVGADKRNTKEELGNHQIGLAISK